MSFRVNTNVPALQTQNSLSRTNRDIEESSAKLSSGQRITKAADDAAGLAISEKLKAHIRSGRMANRNANDGISLVQVAEGGLNEASSILTRMRELAMQSSTDTLDDSDRMNSGYEFDALKSELERLSQVTEFNGRKLLNGSAGRLTFQVGLGDNSLDDHISIEPGNLSASVDSLGIAHESIRSKYSAQASLAKLDRAISQIAGHRSQLGSVQNRLVSSTNNLGIYTQNMDATNSRIRDTDFAEETAKQAKNSILLDAGSAVMAQAQTSGKGALKLL